MVYDPGPLDLLLLEHRKYNPRQPRDKNGRWGSGGGVGIGEDIIAGSDGSAVAEQIRRDPFGEGAARNSMDPMLHQIADRQGFTGTPHVVDREEMDRQVAGGAEEIFHGTRGTYVDERGDLTAAQMNEDYRSGPAYYNNGMYGNGVYATNLRGTAEGEYSDGTSGSVMRMAIPADAKVVDYGALEAEHQQYLSGVDPSSSEAVVYGDPGRFAAARGYDVVRIEGASPYADENWYIVLNRSAMLVEKA